MDTEKKADDLFLNLDDEFPGVRPGTILANTKDALKLTAINTLRVSLDGGHTPDESVTDALEAMRAKMRTLLECTSTYEKEVDPKRGRKHRRPGHTSKTERDQLLNDEEGE